MTQYLACAASQRPNSHNAALARAACKLLEAKGSTIDWVDYARIVPPTYDDKRYAEAELPGPVRHFLAHLRAADGWLLASPEYNWSFPGSLKTLIDWISLLRPMPLAGVPVLLLSASPSRRGGLLGLTQLQQPLVALGAQVYSRYFSLSLENETYDAQGQLADLALRQELEEVLHGFHRFTYSHTRKD